jgi:hypothetical protein
VFGAHAALTPDATPLGVTHWEHYHTSSIQYEVSRLRRRINRTTDGDCLPLHQVSDMSASLIELRLLLYIRGALDPAITPRVVLGLIPRRSGLIG